MSDQPTQRKDSQQGDPTPKRDPPSALDPVECPAERTLRMEPRNSDDRAPRQHCLVVVQGPELARRFLLNEELVVIGRSPQCAIILFGPGISRQHCRVMHVAGEYVLTDLGSTNGTWVNGRKIDWQRLEDGDRIHIGNHILRFLSATNVENAYYDEIYRLTTTDDITGLFNRRYFFQNLERELSRALRHGRDLSLLMLGVDQLDELSNELGPLATDSLLIQLAAQITRHIRREDILARLDHETFCLLLPETDAEGARTVIRRLRALVQGTPFQYDGEDIHASLSCGLCSLAELMPLTEIGRNKEDIVARKLDHMLETAAIRLQEDHRAPDAP